MKSRLSVAAVAILVFAVIAPSSGAYVDPVCNDLPITLRGSGLIIGTEGDDVILASFEADEVHGLGGNDTICTMNGDDIVFGGPGDDWINTGIGDDIVYGEQGDDWVNSGTASAVSAGKA